MLLGLGVVHHRLGDVVQPARCTMVSIDSLMATLRGTFLNDVLDAELPGARSQDLALKSANKACLRQGSSWWW